MTRSRFKLVAFVAAVSSATMKAKARNLWHNAGSQQSAVRTLLSSLCFGFQELFYCVFIAPCSRVAFQLHMCLCRTSLFHDLPGLHRNETNIIHTSLIKTVIVVVAIVVKLNRLQKLNCYWVIKSQCEANNRIRFSGSKSKIISWL